MVGAYPVFCTSAMLLELEGNASEFVFGLLEVPLSNVLVEGGA